MLNLHCRNDNKLRLLSTILSGCITIAFQLLSMQDGSQGSLLHTQAPCLMTLTLHMQILIIQRKEMSIKHFYSGAVDFPLLICGQNSQNFVLEQLIEGQIECYGGNSTIIVIED